MRQYGIRLRNGLLLVTNSRLREHFHNPGSSQTAKEVMSFQIVIDVYLCVIHHAFVHDWMTDSPDHNSMALRCSPIPRSERLSPHCSHLSTCILVKSCIQILSVVNSSPLLTAAITATLAALEAYECIPAVSDAPSTSHADLRFLSSLSLWFGTHAVFE